MSKSIKLLAVLGLVGVLAACGNNNNDDEFVVVEPVSEEPTFTGKLK
jgi:outer membrane lipopolysaccharide assembly protein LptE/RlpB